MTNATANRNAHQSLKAAIYGTTMASKRIALLNKAAYNFNLTGDLKTAAKCYLWAAMTNSEFRSALQG